MKKIVSFIIVFCLILSCTNLSHAAEKIETDQVINTAALSRDELIFLACDAFPQHAEKISTLLTTSAYSMLSSAELSLVTKEQVQLEENEVLTYYEYANNLALITYYKQWTQTSSNVYGNETTVSGILYVTCNASTDFFNLTGFSYSIVSTGFDFISNLGSHSLSNCDVDPYLIRYNETAILPACYTLTLTFSVLEGIEDTGALPYQAILELKVQNNSFTISVNGK